MDVDEILETLYDLRAVFGRLDDEYRQSRVDVAIEQLEECNDMEEQYRTLEVWERAVDGEYPNLLEELED